ncbi:ferrochelatase [Synoicihabitans lomoniglobus]|uniref:Ferrochelatase n=1 Tax=Synoicihabitans lomoniglobus TaxID=2909285 RepID=A0AAE9ZYZ3_9BACT|nr:ferrochelatase [Opitutaceae bacterium LMO-M01]WED63022.1 ferrochelatase [Opitutaceae bacterium LMO-M01]
MSNRAVLLVNLGSPDSTDVPDVRTYLREFLGDHRVIDKPAWAPARRFLVNQIITRFRAPKSAEAYKTIWTDEGSPLVVTSQRVRDKLAAVLGTDTPVYLAMRYRLPSIGAVIDQMVADGITEVFLIPQYPHYAMSSWESVVVKVHEEVARLTTPIKVDCIQPFYEDADYIDALYEVSRPALEKPHDHLLFSYHSIPERHLREADASQAHCTIVPDCCSTCSAAHGMCYKAQVLKTTAAFVKRAGLADDQWSVSFQSRLAGEPWLVPYTDYELEHFAKTEGKKNLVVMTPAFVADCLETLEEIAVEGKEEFLKAGGESFHHVPCLNDQAPFIDFLHGRVRRWLGGETPTATKATLSAEMFAR